MSRAERIRNIKLGVAALGSVALLALAYWLVGSLLFTGRMVPFSAVFREVSGIESGTPVTMAGIKVGVVDRVTLTPDNRAEVAMRIRADARLPEGSRARIASMSLLGDRFVEILPGPPDGRPLRQGAKLPSVETPGIDDLLPKVARTLDRLDTLGAAVQDNVEKVGESLQSLLQDAAIRENLRSTMRNANLSALQALALLTDVRRIARENEDEVRIIAANLVEASRKIADAADRTDALVAGVSRRDVQEILSSLRSAARTLEAAASNAEQLTGDPSLREDLSATLRNTREATEDAKAAMARVAELVGARRKQPAGTPLPRPASGAGAALDFIYDADRGKARVDAEYTFVPGGSSFYRMGLFDIGESSRVNLQIGRNLAEGQSLRWGLYQSRLSLGYDWQADGPLMLRTDLYRLNDPRLDVKARYGLRENVAAWLGVESIGGGDERPVAGLQFRF
ncbi:MAG: hypothetical protein KatS3mg024_0372 [Armatimonadota bacterium]|nr:MAG: hypothetical protein KatS3mg024_0372 [Armatimonadota bacterium]